MTSIESLNTAFRIVSELMNEDCFDFEDVMGLNFEEQKDYLRTAILAYFSIGETTLGGIIERVFNDSTYEYVTSLQGSLKVLSSFL